MLDIVEFTVMKMTDTPNVFPRRVRRALSRPFERLRHANVTPDTTRIELKQNFGARRISIELRRRLLVFQLGQSGKWHRLPSLPGLNCRRPTGRVIQQLEPGLT